MRMNQSCSGEVPSVRDARRRRARRQMSAREGQCDLRIPRLPVAGHSDSAGQSRRVCRTAWLRADPDRELRRPVSARRRLKSALRHVAAAASMKRPRLRWYQYSLRTLFLLTLIVSLLMSWHAVKMKKAMAQKKAVEAILAAGRHGRV